MCNIHNRGKAAFTNLMYDSDFLANFNPGDTFRYEDKVYRIKSVEAALQGSGDNKSDVIVFVCHPIAAKEIWDLNKEIKKESIIKKIINKIKSWVDKLE